MHKIDKRLAELGITLPSPAKPVASYVPWVRTGNLIFVSGQITMVDGKPQHIGKLGADISVEDGVKAARTCAINILSHLRDACDGNLDRVIRIVKLVGFVNSTPDFVKQPTIINGASDLLGEVFGEKGRHARSAVSVASLPFGVSVEIEAIAEIE